MFLLILSADSELGAECLPLRLRHERGPFDTLALEELEQGLGLLWFMCLLVYAPSQRLALVAKPGERCK